MKKQFLVTIILSLVMANVYGQKVIVHLTSGTNVPYDASEVSEITFEEAVIITPYTPTDDGTYHNGYEYVDLGLPSGLKWATCNIGASASEEYGDYYAWGETETKSDYSSDTYKWFASATVTEDGSDVTYRGYTKYMERWCSSLLGYKSFCDDKTTLEAEDDVAHVKWGGNWRMPTSSELAELNKECTWTWAMLNGKYGYKITGPNGKYIFLPAAGDRIDSSLNDAGSLGVYCCSSLDSGFPQINECLSFNSDVHDVGGSSGRESGQSVRPVTE